MENQVNSTVLSIRIQHRIKQDTQGGANLT